MKSLSILLWFVLFATSAAAGDRYANIHTVGIVSAIGDFVSMNRVSLIAGLDKACLIDTADWQLDDAIAERITTLISPRFAVKPVTVDRTEFYNYWELEQHLRRYLTTLPAKNGVDAYIIVSKRRLTASTGRGPSIFGLTVMDTFLGEPTVSALYQIEVLDAKSGKQIAFAVGHTGTGLNSTEVIKDVDETYWSATASGFSAEQKQKLKSVVSEITLNSLPYALYTADLIPEIPPAVPASSSP